MLEATISNAVVRKERKYNSEKGRHVWTRKMKKNAVMVMVGDLSCVGEREQVVMRF